MIFLQDDESKQHFLVDTGASFSVLLHHSQSTPSGPPISGADGKNNPCCGQLFHRLTFGLRTFFSPSYLPPIPDPSLV
jgi:hypothetical protein